MPDRTDASRTARLAAPEFDRQPAVSLLLGHRLAPALPPAPVRLAQALSCKVAPERTGRHALAPVAAARRSLLGPAAEGPPRFLVRVDEFPYSTAFDQPEAYGVEPSARFHSVFAAAGVPYLMAIVPQLVHRPLDPNASGGRPLNSEEKELIKRMAGDGVVFAAHGLNHRTRDPRPRHRSELIGLSRNGVGDLVTESLAMLATFDVVPRVFVPPFNRFAADHYPALAAHFDVVCGGPESILYLGLQPTPRWLGNAVYCPSYAPLYGTAREALPEVEHAIEARTGTWIPVTLHLSWEIDDRLEWLKRLLDRLAPYAASWTELLEAADASADGR